MSGRFIIGVDVGGTNLKAALLDANLQIQDKLVIDSCAGDRPESVVAKIAMVVERLAAGAPGRRLTGVGVGVPGVVDGADGRVGRAAQFPEWREVPLRRLLQAQLSVPVFVDHDLRLLTLGEMRRGAGRGRTDFVNAAIGTGIGISIVIGGQIYRRSTGDWGHSSIDYRGKPCICGSRGCLEAYASGWGIARTARELVAGGTRSAVLALADGDPKRIDAAKVFAAAQAGDGPCLEIVRQAGEALGIGMVNLFATLNPEVIIVGGGVASAGGTLFAPIRQTLKQRAVFWPDADQRVIPAQLGDDAGVIGAGFLVRDRLTQGLATGRPAGTGRKARRK